MTISMVAVGAMLAFSPVGSLFLKSPVNEADPHGVSDWVHADDAAASCDALHSPYYNEVHEPEGERVEDFNHGKMWFLAKTGAFYSMKYEDNGWTTIGDGAWIPVAFAQPGVWEGQDMQFLQDPRPAPLAARWYQVGPGTECHVFFEKTRTTGPAGTQTVALDSGVAGIPGWTLKTGRAELGTVQKLGNWRVLAP